ncbi:MAG TPA: site-specific DNA-methyltransferase [Rhizomicrobium sp.]|nr:site-specific DNA-methyltransferase [Rhizomicrobium sp.]
MGTSKLNLSSTFSAKPIVEGKIVLRDVQDLKPRSRNPRTHSPKQIEQIARSIQRFGFVNPVLVGADGGIIAGHGRAEAAKLLGLQQVPTLRVDHLSEAEIRAYVIADNKLAENAGWDKDLLALELKELSIELDLEITLTGFETPEIDILLQPAQEDEEPEIAPVNRDVPPVSRAGDLWLIGEHRLFCGDALDPTSYRQLLGEDKAGLVFTDPPYNVPIEGHVSGLGRAAHREFAMASGEMTSQEFEQFLAQVFRNLAAFSRDGALNYICMDWRHTRELLDAGFAAYTEFKNLCVWAKTNAGMGSLYRSQHELVFVFKNGHAPHVNNIQLGRHGRNRSNLWTYAGMNSFGKDRDEELAMHPTVKPVGLVADAILDASLRGDIILDAFTGSGTTLLAAQKTRRRGYGIEIDPAYADLTIARLSAAYGLEALLTPGDIPFSEVAASRQPRGADHG